MQDISLSDTIHLGKCSRQETRNNSFWVIVTHLEETEVSRCQSSQSDDHLCCWSFSDESTTFLQGRKKTVITPQVNNVGNMKFVIHKKVHFSYVEIKITERRWNYPVFCWDQTKYTYFTVAELFHLACPIYHVVTRDSSSKSGPCLSDVMNIFWTFSCLV